MEFKGVVELPFQMSAEIIVGLNSCGWIVDEVVRWRILVRNFAVSPFQRIGY